MIQLVAFLLEKFRCEILDVRCETVQKPPAKVQDVSAASGLLLQKCRAFPQSADCCCKSAGRFRSQRIVAAKVREQSTGVKTFSQKCRSIFTPVYSRNSLSFTN